MSRTIGGVLSRVSAICLGLWLGGGVVTRADEPPASTDFQARFGLAADASEWIPSILFIGNSFTHGAFQPVRGYNAGAITDENFGLPHDNPRAENVEPGPYGGIPGIFRKLADEAGWPCEVHMEAVSAQTLAFHSQHALPVLAQRRWDVVVLQDYSTGPLPTRRRGNPARFFRSATLLEGMVHDLNPRARLFLYETWPRADLTFRPDQPYSGEGIEAMAAGLHDAYYQEAARDPRFEGVAAVGDAWLRAIRSGVALANPYAPREAGKINLWAADSYHPGVHGAYLAALVLFQRITGVCPGDFGDDERAAIDLGISRAEAADLRRIASEQGTETAR